MGVEFNTEDMLDTYLFENGQLLENLQEIVLEQKDEELQQSKEELQQSKEELQQSKEELQQKASKIEELMRRISELEGQTAQEIPKRNLKSGY